MNAVAQLKFDHARDRQIREFTELLLQFWQGDPTWTFEEILTQLHFYLDDDLREVAHEDAAMYDALKGMFREQGVTDGG